MSTPGTGSAYDARWRAALAPRTGDVRKELTLEAAEYLNLPFEDASRRVEQSGDEFPAEWARLVTDPSNPEQLVRFYNESESELFEQIAWHSGERIHHRSLVCSDLAVQAPGREFLDYGSGIGSNALVFGLAGFRVTLADIADPLRNFAKWRCERRGIDVRTIDLKHRTIEQARYDVVTCFDVLEHVPRPMQALKAIRTGLRSGGLFFLYAPFGYDPDRPMHIVHDDGVFKKIRALGFARKYAWENAFPAYLREPMPPIPYERVARSPLVNAAYFVRDVWLDGRTGDVLSRPLRVLRRGAPGKPADPGARAGA